MSESPRARSSKAAVARQVLLSYGYMLLWIFLSSSVILVNKYILDPKLGGFPFPVTLTATHMLFCSIVSWAIIKAGLVKAPAVTKELFFGAVVPIGALFAITLWLGNAAYLYLSVSFIQMIKASMPVLVYLTGCMFGTEVLKGSTMANMVVVGTGICIASYGELEFVLAGVILQVSSIVSEAVRLTMVQLMLQRKGVQLNPITTMYLVSPVCFGFLLGPLTFFEAQLLVQQTHAIRPGPLVASVLAAFALNVSVFLLIGKTSALTMNVAGIMKDWLLICASVFMFGSPVTKVQLFGYCMALSGVFWYNYQRIKSAVNNQPPTAPAVAAALKPGSQAADAPTAPLLDDGKTNKA